MDGTGCECPPAHLNTSVVDGFRFLVPRFVANVNLQHNSFGGTLVLVYHFVGFLSAAVRFVAFRRRLSKYLKMQH